MSRNPGTFTISDNYEVTKAAPFDARTLVSTKADLISANSYPSKLRIYNGMLVSVAADPVAKNNGVYRLIDKSDFTNPDYSAWAKVFEANDVSSIIIDGGEVV